MNTIFTPSDLISIVLDKKTTDFRFKPYDNKLQKFSFFSSIAFLILGFFSGLIFSIINQDYIAWSGIVFISLSIFSVLIYQLSFSIPEVIKLKNPEREVSSQLTKNFNDDMDLIYHLSSNYQSHHLSYAKEMYGHMAKQLRERIGILVGAIDKVGIIPIAVTSYLSYSKAVRDGISFGAYEWIGIAFIILYFLAIRLTNTAQWMEYISEIYSHAYILSSNNPSKLLINSSIHPEIKSTYSSRS